MTKPLTATIGYYTVTENDCTGWTGGLLILDGGGRPLEFQCTLPVRPSRSHQILFGPTLRQHLIGEVIGGLLIKKSKTPIDLLCCDQPESLRLASLAECPVVLVDDGAEKESEPIAEGTMAGAGIVPIAGSNFRVPLEMIEEVERMANLYGELPCAVEPFERIREAIGEAHSQLARQRDAA